MTEKAFQSISKNFEKLEYFNLYADADLTDNAFGTLAQSRKSLPLIKASLSQNQVLGLLRLQTPQRQQRDCIDKELSTPYLFEPGKKHITDRC